MEVRQRTSTSNRVLESRRLGRFRAPVGYTSLRAAAQRGSAINKSLLVLGEVISKLSSAGSAPSSASHARKVPRRVGSAKKVATHIPYRSSKLTRILKQSLGGNTYTSLLCTITPSPLHREESVNTLKFGTMCKTIKNKAKKNQIKSDKALIKEYKKQMEDMKRNMEAMLEAERSKVKAQEARVQEMVLKRLREKSLRRRSSIGPLDEANVSARRIQRVWRKYELKKLRELRLKLEEDKEKQKMMTKELIELRFGSSKSLTLNVSDETRKRAGSHGTRNKRMRNKRMSMFVTSDGGPRALIREKSMISLSPRGHGHRRALSGATALRKMRSFRTEGSFDENEELKQDDVQVEMSKVRAILKKKEEQNIAVVQEKNSEIEDLAQKLHFFESRFHSLVKDSNERDAYEEKMREAFDALEKQNEQLRVELEASHVAVRQMTASADSFKQALADERSVRAKAETELSSMQHNVTRKFGRRLSVVLRDVEKDIASIDKEKGALGHRIDAIETQEKSLDRREASVKAKEMMLERTSQRLSKLESRLIEQETRLEGKERDLSLREERHVRLMASLEQDRRNHKIDVHRIERTEMEMQRMRDSLLGDREELDKSISIFEEKLKAAKERERLAHAARRIQAFRRRTRARMLQHRESAVEVLEERYKDIDARDEMLSDRIDDLERENERLSKLKLEVEASRSHAVGAQAALEAKERAFRQRDRRIRELEADNDLLSEALRERKDELAIQESVMEMREREILEKTNELREKERQVRKLTRDSANASKEHEEISRLHKEKDRELMFRERQIEKLMEEIERGEQMLEGRAMTLKKRERKVESMAVMSRRLSIASSGSSGGFPREAGAKQPSEESEALADLKSRFASAQSEAMLHKRAAQAKDREIEAMATSLDSLCEVFADVLEAAGFASAALNDATKRRLVDRFSKAKMLVTAATAGGDQLYARSWRAAKGSNSSPTNRRSPQRVTIDLQ